MERFANAHQTMRWVAKAAGLALMALPLQALALHLQQTSGGQTITRNGVAAAVGVAKLSIEPSFPYNQVNSATITATADAGNPASSTSTDTDEAAFTVDSDPGDAPNAQLCVIYHYSAELSGGVSVDTGSIAGGAGGMSGFNVNAATAPASATTPNQATLTLTPSVGSPIQLFSAGPSTFATTGASQTIQIHGDGTVFVGAGDTLALDSEVGIAARGEMPDGESVGNYRVVFKLDPCPGPAAPVPTLSNRANWALASLLLVFALLVLARRRASDAHTIS